jgi:signal transduction histidine kinase
MEHDQTRTNRLTPRAASRLAWALFGLVIVVLAAATWLSLAAHRPGTVLPFLPVLLAFAVVGAVVASRRPSNPLGWLMLAMNTTTVGGLADAYARFGSTKTPHLVGTAWAAWVFIISIEVSTIPLALILLLFPHGRLLSPRWRAAVWATVVFAGASGVLTAISDVNFSVKWNFPMLRDPVRLLSPSTVTPVYNGAQLGNLLAILVAAASLVLRLRRSEGEERHQVKWIAFAGLLAAIRFIVLANIPNGPEPVLAFIVLVPLIPVAAGVAILKYRLYDIDVVINKTVVYGLLAGFITAVYVGIVVGIGALIGQGTSKPNLGLSILATAVVAVAFSPVRDRVQRLANRLVYGQRATPYEVLSEFSARMSTSYATEDLLPRMARILAEGTGARSAVVWLKVGDRLKPEAAWPLDDLPGGSLSIQGGGLPAIEATLALPVEHRGELLGALSLTKAPGERLTPAEEHLARDLASGAGLVLRNVRLTEELLARLEELRASRQRLVAAQDAERRRLERNIHDGAQQQLVALAVKARLARGLTAKDPERAAQMLTQVEAEITAALEDLRDLARGIYPPLLADQGLVAALESQARRAPMPVGVQADGIGRYPQEREAAVYFCVLEALQNAGKYAGATSVTVRLADTGGQLTFEVSDDGVGFDPSSTSYGTGMQGMADRLSALDGELQVRSHPGEGTTVAGALPLSEAPRENVAVGST